MNIQQMKLSALILGIAFSSSVIAESNTGSCGKLKASMFPHTATKAPLVIISHNGVDLAKNRIHTKNVAFLKGKKIPVGNTMHLAEGYHEFSAIAVEVSASVNNENRIQRSEKQSTIEKLGLTSSNRTHIFRPIGARYNIIRFGLNVESDKIYRIMAKKNENSSLFDSVKIASVKHSECSSSSISPAKSQPQLVNFESNLPKSLQLRLDALSKDIADHYRGLNKPMAAINLMLPRRAESNVGIVLDLDSDVRQGLLIEAVTPRTFADSLGLEANDKIISFNGSSLTANKNTESAIITLQKLLLEAKDKSKITVEVIRDGSPKTLTTIYNEIPLPEVRATIG